jgi:CRISPR-associated protein Cas1
MTPLFIDKPDLELTLQNKTIKIDGKTIPLRLIDVIVIAAPISLSSKTMAKITDENINIILLNPHNYKATLISSAQSKNAQLKLSQYQSLEKRVQIAKQIIETKILNHNAHLKFCDIDQPINSTLSSLREASSVESILGIEGTYSRTYFQHYFSLVPRKFHLGKRSKRPPLDPTNALLSYLYSMAYSLISSKLLIQGYEPGIGYLHTPFRDHSALASDMLELFRHHINDTVLSLFQNGVVGIDDFYKKEGVYLNYEGRKKLYVPIKTLWTQMEPDINKSLAWLRNQLCQNPL